MWLCRTYRGRVLCCCDAIPFSECYCAIAVGPLERSDVSRYIKWCWSEWKQSGWKCHKWRWTNSISMHCNWCTRTDGKKQKNAYIFDLISFCVCCVFFCIIYFLSFDPSLLHSLYRYDDSFKCLFRNGSDMLLFIALLRTKRWEKKNKRMEQKKRKETKMSKSGKK